MARYFLNLQADFNRGERHSVARGLSERDDRTCAAPECLRQGGLECDHAISRAHGGRDALRNLSGLRAAEYRHTRHTVGRLVLYGQAPDNPTVRMGGRSIARIGS